MADKLNWHALLKNTIVPAMAFYWYVLKWILYAVFSSITLATCFWILIGGRLNTDYGNRFCFTQIIQIWFTIMIYYNNGILFLR